MILSLQEVELLLDPVAGLGDSELQRLTRLVGDLNPNQSACGEGREEELSHQSSQSRYTLTHIHTGETVDDKRPL